MMVPSKDVQELQARIVQLETLLTLLQQDLDDLSGTLVDQNRKWLEASKRINILESRFEQMSGNRNAAPWYSGDERESEEDSRSHDA